MDGGRRPKNYAIIHTAEFYCADCADDDGSDILWITLIRTIFDVVKVRNCEMPVACRMICPLRRRTCWMADGCIEYDLILNARAENALYLLRIWENCVSNQLETIDEERQMSSAKRKCKQWKIRIHTCICRYLTTHTIANFVYVYQIMQAVNEKRTWKKIFKPVWQQAKWVRLMLYTNWSKIKFGTYSLLPTCTFDRWLCVKQSSKVIKQKSVFKKLDICYGIFI